MIILLWNHPPRNAVVKNTLKRDIVQYGLQYTYFSFFLALSGGANKEENYP